VAIEIGQWDQPGRIARPAAEQHVVVAATPSAASPVYGGFGAQPNLPPVGARRLERAVHRSRNPLRWRK